MINREKYLARKRKYYAENKAQWADYAKRNRVKLLEYKSQYRDAKPHMIKVWRAANKQRIAKKRRQYNQAHKKEAAAYMKQRLRTCIHVRIRQSLRARIYDTLRRNGFGKSVGTYELLGCDFETLKKQIESRFQVGMSWVNYGKWQIDHIIPCAAFDLTRIEDQRRCFNFANLQPLWEFDNKSKGAKILHEYLHNARTTEAPPPA